MPPSLLCGIESARSEEEEILLSLVLSATRKWLAYCTRGYAEFGKFQPCYDTEMCSDFLCFACFATLLCFLGSYISYLTQHMRSILYQYLLCTYNISTVEKNWAFLNGGG